MHCLFIFSLAGLLALASCSSPPKPPTVNPSDRHAVNTGAEVDLQICKSDLRNTQIQSRDAGRQAASASATLDALVARQKVIAGLRAGLRAMESGPTAGNSIYTVRFEFGSARVDIPVAAAHALIEQARSSPLVMLRGRTDGIADSQAESRIARDRAAAVRDYLVSAGVDPGRIRATFQPSGDQVADNTSQAGRSLNRRVEIELYRALPISLEASSATP